MNRHVKFLREMAEYFEKRSTGNVDRAVHANVSNARNCMEAADEFERLISSD